MCCCGGLPRLNRPKIAVAIICLSWPVRLTYEFKQNAAFADHVGYQNVKFDFGSPRCGAKTTSTTNFVLYWTAVQVRNGSQEASLYSLLDDQGMRVKLSDEQEIGESGCLSSDILSNGR